MKDATASTRLVAAHRIGGYLFIALFCVMGYFMLDRLGDASGSASPGTMDDLCLETNVTLLYCVRTSSDIIFHDELEALRARLKNFQVHVLLSQPNAEWSGGRGHINREFIEDTIKELYRQTSFFAARLRSWKRVAIS